MYNAFFELEENPFSPEPDQACFYRSKRHDTSLRSLLFTVQSRMGLSSLTGEEGTGKTILLECLRDALETNQIQCAFLRDSRMSSARLFQAIASELDLRCQGTSPYQVFTALHQLTLQQARKGRTVALLVDDAHSLSADVLNEILHLASLHDDKVKLVQTVLAGRPQLLATLDALNLERLKQHAILSCHLDPFTAEETQNYIEFRLAQAGLTDQTIFPPEAFAEIHLRSRGFPAAIHAVCEGLLLAAFSAGSKVCTPEILDQAFHRTHREEPEIVGVIDLPLLEVGSEPEPPALLTALLRLTFAAIKILPPPLPVDANDTLEALCDALQVVFPIRNFALPVGEFPVGSKKPLHLTDGASAASSFTRLVQPQVLAISTPAAAISRPVVSQPAVLAEPRPAGELQRIRPNIRASNAALIASPSAVLAIPVDFASVTLQPANPGIESLKARAVLLTPEGVNKLSRLSCTIKPNCGSLAQKCAEPSVLDIPATRAPMAIQFTGSFIHPGDSAGAPRQAVAPRVSNTLFPLPCSVAPRPVIAGAPVDAQSSCVYVPPTLQPAQPAANLQTAGTVQLPRVPVTPFEAAVSDPHSPRTSTDSEVHLGLQNPVGPRMATDLTAFSESNVAERNHLFSLACNVPPSAPSAGTPIRASVTPVQSLQPHGPVSKLEPVNPRSSWLLLPSWKPLETPAAAAVEPDSAEPVFPEPASVQAGKPFPVASKWLLALAASILVGLALHSLSPAGLPGADALSQRWRRAHQAVLDRAAVALRDDFRTGLDDWMNRGGARPSWTSDAAGFVHPAALALYRPSLGLTDYQVQFVGMIDKKALSWVVRAADFNNYYVVRLSVLKPGAVPSIGVTRYAVIDGKIHDQITTPLLMSARSDTVYRVSLDVHGNHYALSVQNQPVDSWSEPKLAQGGVGFFSDQDAASRVTAVQVKGQYDMLGRLCAFLAPSAVTSYRASLSEHAALTMTADMNPRSGGRGGLTSSSSYGNRLPRGGARLDPAFWQLPEVNVPNARRCGPGSGRGGGVRTRRISPYSGASSLTNCY